MTASTKPDHLSTEPGLHERPPVATGEPLVRLEAVATHFAERRGLAGWLQRRPREVVRAVDGVDLEIRRGEVLGLVGESGSGKTTLGKTILRLVPLTRGRIFLDQRDLSEIAGSELRRVRGGMQMIFQDPYSSLSPRLRVSYTLSEPYRIHRTPSSDQYSVTELLGMVELPRDIAPKFPHELSGGQARRVGIARALALHPHFLVADEPTAGLDVSAASSVLNLMSDLGSRLDLTYLIITHNLSILGYVADRIAVMYLGEVIEIGPTDAIYDAPSHPYTIALLASISEPDPKKKHERRRLVAGEIPSPKHPPSGCRFHPRCRFAQPICAEQAPPLAQISAVHSVACHFWPAARAAAAEERISKEAIVRP